MKELQEHIDEVMDWFDFRRVVDVMTFLDWRWKDEPVEEFMLRKSVREKMKQVYGKNLTVASGGLWVRYCVEDDSFDVKFVLTDWETGEI